MSEAHQAIEAVFRIERARLVAGLARMVRDVDRAEELAQDALVTALGEWPSTGVPRNPGAWLMAAAKRRAIDGFRRETMLARKHAEIGRDLEDARDESVEAVEASFAGDANVQKIISFIRAGGKRRITLPRGSAERDS